jgi:hypothetical protein
MAKKTTEDSLRLVITNVDPFIKDKLQLIAKNKGVTLSQFLRPKLRKVIDTEHPNFLQNWDPLQ